MYIQLTVIVIFIIITYYSYISVIINTFFKNLYNGGIENLILKFLNNSMYSYNKDFVGSSYILVYPLVDNVDKNRDGKSNTHGGKKDNNKIARRNSDSGGSVNNNPNGNNYNNGIITDGIQGYVAISNNTIIANFDNKGFIYSPSRECRENGLYGYIRLPIPLKDKIPIDEDVKLFDTSKNNNNYDADDAAVTREVVVIKEIPKKYENINILQPENQCLPSAMHFLIQESLYNPVSVPAYVRLDFDTGVFTVDMANSLLKAGYLVITNDN